MADDLLRQGDGIVYPEGQRNTLSKKLHATKGLTDLHRLLNKSKNKDKDMGDR
ncbi:hypothetical protein D3C75_1260310 [compost metagenome]